jgi:gamma-glutamyltranspeptidase/glutathione hydrolase
MIAGTEAEMANARESGWETMKGAESMEGVWAPSRGPVYGMKYAVAIDQPLASMQAMEVMRKGGNAADAIIAASAINLVTKPYFTQLGGDAFSLVWRRADSSVDAMNAGGRAPKAATPDRFPDGIPEAGVLTNTVPSVVDGILEMHTRYATLSIDTLLAPAIQLCEDGFAVPMRFSGAMHSLLRLRGREFDEIKRVYLKDGEPYAPGDVLRLPELGKTLQRIVDGGREGFYEGETAALITKAMADFGGLVAQEDLREEQAVWGDPISTSFAGCIVFEQPLPSQGIILLLALNIVEHFPLADWGPASPDALHVMVEATRLAFADSRRYSADPDFEAIPLEELLSKQHGKKQAARIDMKRAQQPVAASFGSDTTEFVAADQEMAIAFIQTVFSGWGSKFMIPGAGILMTDRMRGFSLDPSAANRLVPGKRTVHTLNTFIALREDGSVALAGGTPGRDYQVQNNLQTLVGHLVWGLDPQQAIDMPRFVTHGDKLALEGRFPNSVFDDLASRGHDMVRLAGWDGAVARSQVITGLPNGGWGAASDLRGDGVALAV